MLAIALGALGASTAACSNQPNGALVVAVETDVPLPKDVDTIEIQVEADGSVQFDNPYAVGSGHLLVPATLTLLPGSNAAEPVTIRLLAYQGGTVRMLRQTITTVPTTRVATLLMPIQWLDFGMTTGGSAMDPSAVQPACPTGQTPDEGTCIGDTIDSTTLPTTRRPQSLEAATAQALAGVSISLGASRRRALKLPTRATAPSPTAPTTS